ncbi:MAG TPA: SpoIIE family protein phosphatase, partial [Tepidisphaeraceae bacterium]|nr:SpoIIE family protein phosphatase [Tepidisphaeraceae bacterium]
MRLGTKILLLMLLITIGTAATLAWIVTLNVTRYETRRADERISQAIGRYVSQLEDHHRQIQKVVRALLEAPDARSQLQAADEARDPSALEQLKQEVLGRTVQTELDSPQGKPAFHVIVNEASELVVAVSPGEASLAQLLVEKKIHWPIEEVTASGDQPVSNYVATPAGLFLAMGVPLHTQLNEPPSHAYFVGFRVDDQWVRQQLLSDRRVSSSGTDAPLAAWFMVDRNIVARACADPGDERIKQFTADTALKTRARGTLGQQRSLRAYDSIELTNAGEHYLGKAFDLAPAGASNGKLVLASSLDQALLPLRSLQRQILFCTIIACAVAVLACRYIAGRIANPVQELVIGTQRIASGEFDEPVKIRRRDELGTLASAFNQMSQGLKERDALREKDMKIQHDLAIARRIQMDVLPREIPPCPGYDMVAYSLPAEQTGGDIYDLVALALDDEDPSKPPSLVLLLADATGHGIGPALSVTQVRAMLRIGVRLRAELSNVLSQMNRQLCQDLGAERFVTAFLGLLDPSHHSVNYYSAGQAPLLHFRSRDRRIEWLDSSMLPLGID